MQKFIIERVIGFEGYFFGGENGYAYKRNTKQSSKTIKYELHNIFDKLLSIQELG